MTAMQPARAWLGVGVFAVGLFIFGLDLFLPLGVAVGVLYVVPVLLSLWLPSRIHTMAIAGVSTALTLVGYAFSPSGLVWIGLLNRVLTVALIWAVMLVVLLRKRAEERIKTLEGLIPICAACKKIRNDRGYWDVLESYLHEHSEAQFTHGLCPDCMEQYYGSIEQKVQ